MATGTRRTFRPGRSVPPFIDHRMSAASTFDHSEAPSTEEFYELYWPIVLVTGEVATGKTVAVAPSFQTLERLKGGL
jgi:hypothetical protein